MYPDGFQSKYFREEEIEGEPMVKRAGGRIYISVFAETLEGRTKCLVVPIDDHGDDISDVELLKQRRYGDIRRFLYGSMDAQAEMRDDHTYQAHWLSVRKAIPNPTKSQLRTVFSRFEVLKAFKAIPDLYNRLVDTYMSNITIQLYWNTVNDIDIEDEDCIEIRRQLGISDELVKQLINIIEGCDAK